VQVRHPRLATASKHLVSSSLMRLVDWLIVRELLPPLLFGVGLFTTLIFASLHDSFWANWK